MIRAITLITVLLFCCMHALQAAPNEAREHYRVSLLPGSDGITVSEMLYIEDADNIYTPQLFFVQLLANNIHTYTAVPFNKGLVNSRYLMGFSIHNNNQHALTLRLLTGATRAPYLHALVFDENGNRSSVLLDHDQMPFSQRNDSHRLLNSNAFSVQAGQKVYVVIEFKSHGSSYLPLILGTDTAVSQLLHTDDACSLVFYATCCAFILLLAWLGIARKSSALRRLAVFFAFGLLTLSAADGLAFRYLWGNFPQWNAQAELLLLYLTSGFGLLLAWKLSVPTDTNKVLRLSILTAGVTSLLLVAASNWLDDIKLMQWIYAFVSLMVIALLYAIANRLSGNGKCDTLFYLSVAISIIAAVALLLYIHNTMPPGVALIYAMRIACLALMLAAGIPAAVCFDRRATPASP